MVTVVPSGQVKGGEHPETCSLSFPVGPEPQITVHESLVGVGTVKKAPPMTLQVYPVQFAWVR